MNIFREICMLIRVLFMIIKDCVEYKVFLIEEWLKGSIVINIIITIY